MSRRVVNVTCTDLVGFTSILHCSSHKRNRHFSGGLPELLPLHKQPVSWKFPAPVVDRLLCRWRFATSSSETTLYKSDGVRLR